ncbi:hypothetical protein AB2E07_21015 [Escherichia coli]
MSAQEKTVQIDSFDAKFLDINTLSKLIYERMRIFMKGDHSITSIEIG